MKTWKPLAMVSIGAALFASVAGCNRLRGGGATPSTEDEKTLYTLGMLLGRNLGNFNLTADELDMVKSGLTARSKLSDRHATLSIMLIKWEWCIAISSPATSF